MCKRLALGAISAVVALLMFGLCVSPTAKSGEPRKAASPILKALSTTPGVVGDPTDSPKAVLVLPDSMFTGRLIKIKSTGSKGAVFFWNVYPSDLADCGEAFVSADGTQTYVLAYDQPVAAEITLTAIANNQGDQVSKKFTIGSPTPPPPPPPPPPPVNAPTISTLKPATGGVSGGTPVTIIGTNLSGATTVKFGTATAAISNNTGTQLTTTSPPGTGVVDVTVLTATGASNASQFTYAVAPPIPQTGLRALIIYDAAKIDQLPPGQQVICRKADKAVVDYLEGHCSKTGSHADYRIFDVNVDMSRESDDWKTVFNRPHPTLPWIVIQGAGGFWEGPLPIDSVNTLAMLQNLQAGRRSAKMFNIDDNNYKQFIGDGFTVTLPDGTKKYLCRAKSAMYEGAKLKSVRAKDWLEAAGISLIPESKWVDLIKAGQGTFLDTIARPVQPCKDQDGLGYCWVYGTTNCAEVARITANLPYIALSPESIGGPLTNWRNQGGWGGDAVQQYLSTGACANVYMDSANSLSPSRWKSGWEADRANFKALLSLDVKSWDEVITLLLLRIPLTAGYNWWSHEVALYAPTVLSNGQVGLIFRNSWGDSWGDSGFSTLNKSKGTPDDCQAILQMIPAEPNEPATMMLPKNTNYWKKEMKRRYDLLLKPAA